MRVYQISIYDKNWKTLSVDYYHCEDRQAAEQRAEADADWLCAPHWEIRRIR